MSNPKDIRSRRIDLGLRQRDVAGDITAYSIDELAELAGEVDVVIGGPPCQGFSSIRPFRTPTEADPRNALVELYATVISRLKPRWFLFENVVGLLKNQHGQCWRSSGLRVPTSRRFRRVWSRVASVHATAVSTRIGQVPR